MGRSILRIGLSILAAILTFGAVVLLQGLFGNLRFNSLVGTGLWLTSMIMFALGVAVMRFLVPSVYAVALGCMIPATVFMLVTLHPGNLAGLAFWASVLLGLAVALAVGIIGSMLHKSTFPDWMPYAFMGSGVIAFAGVAAASRYVTVKHAAEITDRLQEIRSAELAYAARDPAHGFTCNGSDLSTRGIAWRASASLGTLDKNEAPVDGYWIYLNCEASAHPRSFIIRAFSTEGTGEQLSLDWEGRFTGARKTQR
jgi:hypothetical protein